MKKRVRIYKAPNGEGKFVNKTAQFLKKAQEGGAPDPSMMGYPGGEQAQPQQLTENQLASIVLKDIGSSMPREGIVVKLVNVFGREPNEAMQFVDKMYQYVEQQQQSEIDNAQEEDADTEEIVANEDATYVQPDSIEESFSPQGTAMGNDIALEDTPDDDDSEAASNMIMQYGGYYRAQEGMEVPIEMPDMSAYMPESMTNYYGDPNAASDIAWAAPEMENTDDVEGSMNAYKGFVAPEMPEDIAIGSAKYGGSKQSKKQFVNAVLKLVKKQMGGGQDPQTADSKDDNSDPTGSGIRKKNLNKFIGSIKNESAIAAAKEQAEQHYDQMQQPPMQQYPMAQNGGDQSIYQGQDYENPMHHLALFSKATGDVFGQDQNQMVQAQYGIQSGRLTPQELEQARRYGINDPGFSDNGTRDEIKQRQIQDWIDQQMKSGNVGWGPDANGRPRRDVIWPNEDMEKGLYPNRSNPSPNIYGGGQGMNPFNVRPNPLGRFMGGNRMPAGLQGMPPITRLDVRRSGLFGRPRRYTAEFAQSPMPGMGMPGQGVGFYGYGAQTLRWPATRTKVASEAASVNNAALKEVSKATPDSTATTNAADTNVTSTVSTTTQGTVSSETKPGDTTQTETVTTDGKTETTPTNPTEIKPTDVTEKPEKKEKANGTYSYPGKTGIYKKKDGAWYIDTTGTGKNYQPIKSGDVKARIKTLEANAVAKDAPKPVVTPQVQRDQWGRAKGSKFYGFNPNTGKYEQGNTEKSWTTKGGNQATSFEGTYNTGWDPLSGDFASDKNARYQIVRDKNGKIIPSKSFVAVQQSPDYGGTINVPWNEIPDISTNTGDEDWNSGYGGDMMENKYGGSTYQVGGSTNNLAPDQYGNLQQFVYGGDEYNDMTQGDIDDVYSKNTANGDFPMAQYGRAVRNYFPANIMPQQYAQMQRGPYNPQTGQAQQFIPGAGTNIKSIDVKKSSWLTGAPKKYTITYGNQEMDPRKQNLITLPGSGTQTPESQGRQPMRNDVVSGQPRNSNVEGLGMRAQMAVRQGERQMNRNDRRLGRNPELLDSIYSPEQQAERQTAKEAYLNAMQSKPATPGMTSNQIQGFTDMMQNPAGVPSYSEGKQYFNMPEVPVAAPASTPFSADMLYNMSGPVNTEMQYGGDLRRFMPYVQTGAESPVTFTNNPALAGMSDVDMISLNPGIQGLQGGADWSSMAPQGTVTQKNDDGTKTYGVDATYKGPQQEETIIDPNQIESQQAKKVYSGTPGDVSIDYKTKNAFDPKAMLNVTNAGIRGVTGMIDRARNKKSEAKMYDNLTADNLYASDPSKDRGDYDANTGLFRMDEQGQQWNSRSKQYGGNIYQDGGMVEGDEMFMTEEEIQEFLANGGDLEFI